MERITIDELLRNSPHFTINKVIEKEALKALKEEQKIPVKKYRRLSDVNSELNNTIYTLVNHNYEAPHSRG